jgi:hypothetical protein
MKGRRCRGKRRGRRVKSASWQKRWGSDSDNFGTLTQVPAQYRNALCGPKVLVASNFWVYLYILLNLANRIDFGRQHIVVCREEVHDTSLHLCYHSLVSQALRVPCINLDEPWSDNLQYNIHSQSFEYLHVPCPQVLHPV